MKKLIGIAAMALLAGCATTVTNEKPEEIDPTANVQLDKDPNPYAEYTPAMASSKEKPLTVYWQRENAKAIEDATSFEEVKKVTASEAASAELLAQVKGAYETDPLVGIKIGAVSQRVMCRKWDKAPEARKVWTSALVKAAIESTDTYRKLFFLDQLRWCGSKDQLGDLRKIAKSSKDKAVADMVGIVSRELK